MVHFNIGPGRWDPTGFPYPCGPHMAVGEVPVNSERFFSVGNERVMIRYYTGSDPNSGSGYHLRKEDKFKFLVELMNMNMEDKVSGEHHRNNKYS